ncbi:MAG: sugar transferase [Gammaproteobacteria bacterium]|nr:sugar transferase [Gammaproteobacteria bacterium]
MDGFEGYRIRQTGPEVGGAESIRLDNSVVVPVLGDTEILFEQARNNQVDIVYIAIPLSQKANIDNILTGLGDTTVSMYIVPDLYTAGIMQGHWVAIGSVPTVSVIDTPMLGVGSWLKRIEDIVVSLLVLAVMALPMIVIAVLIKLTSKGPVLYVQKRYGVDCRPIDVYKFRTMSVTESDDEFTQATPNDPRVTPVGSFLRRTSLDELPQFFQRPGWLNVGGRTSTSSCCLE